MDDDLSMADKLIIARSKLWTKELDKLIRRWRNQIGKREKGHSSQTRKFSRRHYVLGGPAVMLAAIVSVGIFATFRNCSDCDDQSSSQCAVDQWIRLISGFIGLISAALTAFLTFMNYADTAADHKSAADDFGSLYRKLDTMLIVPGKVRGDPQIVLQEIRDKYDDLVRRSPALPSKYDAELGFEVFEKSKIAGQVPRPPPKPMATTTTDIRKMIEEDMIENSSEENSTVTIDDIGEIIALQNNYDTEDEDQEVVIAFDLDGGTNYTAAAVAAAAVSAKKDQNETRYLQEALAYEMDRLDRHATSSKIAITGNSKQKNNRNRRKSPRETRRMIPPCPRPEKGNSKKMNENKRRNNRPNPIKTELSDSDGDSKEEVRIEMEEFEEHSEIKSENCEGYYYSD